MRGKRPTKRQKQIIRQSGLNPENWIVTKNLVHQGQLHIKHRHSDKVRVIKIA